MRRILPIELDQRPSVYRRMFEEVWPLMVERSRESRSQENGSDDE
jgi:hypothetical protein